MNINEFLKENGYILSQKPTVAEAVSIVMHKKHVECKGISSFEELTEYAEEYLGPIRNSDFFLNPIQNSIKHSCNSVVQNQWRDWGVIESDATGIYRLTEDGKNRINERIGTFRVEKVFNTVRDIHKELSRVNDRARIKELEAENENLKKKIVWLINSKLDELV